MPSSAVTSSSHDSEETWDIKIRKQMIAPERVQEVYARLDIIRAASDSIANCPYLVPFTDITFSPMFLSLRADANQCRATVGERSSYTLLPRGVDERTAAHCLYHVCLAVAHLHAFGIAHSHLSAGTVLWNEATERVVLLGHLLPISLFTPTSPIGVVSRLCAAPEILRNEPYDTAADVWSVAVVLLQMVLPATKTFETADVEDTDLLSPLVTAVSASGRSLLLQCLKSEPSKRPTITDLLDHPLFTQFNAAYGEEENDHEEASDSASDEEQASETSSGEDATDSSSNEDDDDERTQGLVSTPR